MSGSSKQPVTLVLITFLLVILIYSSVAKFNASAKPKNYNDILCTKNRSPNPGGINYECCYFTNLLPDGKPGQQSHEYCADCQLKPDGSYACGDYHPVFRTTENPPSVGLAQPPTNALPPSTQQQATTCPDGSSPDANGKCPPVTQGSPPSSQSSTEDNTNNNNNKGSNLSQLPPLTGGDSAFSSKPKH
jgi:hypothetical protein